MKVKLANVSVVVLSDSNNPRLLNPDFLTRNDIVPSEWKPTNVLVTPPIAVVQYENGAGVQVEEGKLNFIIADPDKVDWKNVLPNIVSKFLDTLPHVLYRATGLNYVLNSDEPRGQIAEDRLINSMLKNGPWLTFLNGITGTNIELQYRKSMPNLSLKVAVRETQQPEGKVLESYTFIANFHHEFEPGQRAERKKFINEIGARETEAIKLIDLLPLAK
jgi:hypothetical protein